ncbi:biopolymer transporter ExbD [Helicobacter ailurogastricus]|uniref:Tol biopolymer transport system, TolR protein n=1 Tax=Helicobacter ailurogastricus TaxID=1578720 RepID=A0A0K2XG45_9HELI|nr:biopolymer transporter ExbD [Helicobacter ailurogastricus]GMB89745.1 Biopolymer transport protein ExbD [Helicobacter ailurogastricus]CRF41276.1 Tol biopolymer transport system, TolR protein [Helicobacter ailurogastricus]CRF43331.1 Tol biopolymer transport system, TolR protein [Helicobacter ailurogastricus]CRF44568.1 Tol biopolymer transport system, TolR protein [Helicobacter ailurogastricus]
MDFEVWDADKPELNITPLVDIMLVLLAILMVTTPTITYQENIQLPHGSKSARAPKSQFLEVRMDVTGKIYVNEYTYSLANFADSFHALARELDKSMAVHVRADKRLTYDKIIYLLKGIREAGFYKVSLVTSA